MVTCLRCGYEGEEETFDVCFSVYNDLRCPKCRSTNNKHNAEYQDALLSSMKSLGPESECQEKTMIATAHKDKPQVTIAGVFAMQVCVPKNWTDAQAEEFAQSEHPSGTSGGWQVVKDGEDSERVDCEEKIGFVHVLLNV